MSVDVRSLIKKRSLVKAQITRIFNYIKQSESLEKYVLEIRKQKLEEHYNSFVEIQSQIDEQNDSIDQDLAQIEIENLYYDCADFISKHLYEAESIARVPNPLISASPTITTANTILPKIHIRPFNGDFAEWHNFFDTFKSLVHENDSIPITHKFHLLKSYLTGNAASITNSLNATEENYFVAWNLIQKRYNQPRKIVQCHIRALFELPDITRNSLTSLRAFVERAEMHINALKALKQPVEWHEMLIYIITSKLNKTTRTEWEQSVDEDKSPTYEELLAFLHKFSRDAEPGKLFSADHLKVRNKGALADRSGHSKSRNQSHNLVTTQSIPRCVVCYQGHYIQQCPTFLSKSPRDRLKCARTNKLCVNCLRNNHTTAVCSAINCRQCNRRHHTLLHFHTVDDSDQIQGNHQSTTANFGTSPSPIVLTSRSNAEILLSTARVKILDNYNREHDCRILLDSGSQSNFITDRLAKKLNLPQQHLNLRAASGLGQQTSSIEYQVSATLKSTTGDFTCQANFLAIPRITGNLPSRQFNPKGVPIPGHIKLADAEFYKPAEIDLLLGEYLFYKLTGVGRIRLPNDTAILQKTKFGWVISGDVGDYRYKDYQKTHCHVSNLNNDIAKFWEIEEGPIKHRWSNTEQACEKHFLETVQRTSSGRYVVKLPFNNEKSNLRESYRMAFKRFYMLERKFETNHLLREQYTQFLNEYLMLGHMREVTHTANPDQGLYLPHHAIIKESSVTSKIRVVFDGSAKTSAGISLNDTLMIGPTLQDDLFSIITRFRSYTYVLNADIETMHRQVLIDPEDSKYQKIVWRSNPSESLRSYALNTVTYGTASAPYLAVRCLWKLAEDEGKRYPLAARAFKNDFYMDDLLTGANTIEEAQMLREQVVLLGKLGGFNLRQWASNENCLVKKLKSQAIDKQVCLDADSTKRTLGILWNSLEDRIGYQVRVEVGAKRVTKRVILSRISQLFDPLGLLGPIVIRAKVLMQDLWKCNSDWDAPVPESILSRWQTYYNELPVLNHFSVPRKFLIDHAISRKLHGFCDASEAAYGACIHIRSTNQKGETIARLVCAKSRVAPLKSTMLPRLELCAVHLLANLYTNVSKALKLPIESVKFWSDSTITLHWLKTSPHKLKTFVANRVSEIQSYTRPDDWNHIATKENPADYISRGQRPSELITNKHWFLGPEWLSRDEINWPNSRLPDIEIPEVRTVVLTSQIVETEFIHRFSSFTTFATRNWIFGKLSIAELQQAHACIMKIVQKQEFSRELHLLSKNQNIDKKSKLISLNPFIESNGILRVGGRLRHFNINYSQKHPTLLPKGHFITKLLIRREHINQLHAGILGTLNAIRQNYCFYCQCKFRVSPSDNNSSRLSGYSLSLNNAFKAGGVFRPRKIWSNQVARKLSLPLYRPPPRGIKQLADWLTAELRTSISKKVVRDILSEQVSEEKLRTHHISRLTVLSLFDCSLPNDFKTKQPMSSPNIHHRSHIV
ncbi:uncharacterized protein LOC143433153 [Xylocopa sonorina]|uniref:uncharacterized protein LOC143433153 n=1 Tax=Xylocopa sonorina TaxID=1818115 RepID=UPI00403B3478